MAVGFPPSLLNNVLTCGDHYIVEMKVGVGRGKRKRRKRTGKLS